MPRAGRKRAQVKSLRKRDGDACHICKNPMRFDIRSDTGKRVATLDHIIPKSEGGRQCLDNLKLACAGCNRHRGNLKEQAKKRKERKAQQQLPDAARQDGAK